MSESEAEARSDGAPQAPVLRIVGSNPSPEDIAALTVVFASMGSTEQPEPKGSNWVALARRGRYAPRPGPSAWRLSARGR